MSKRPHSEIALTSLLCDLMDEDIDTDIMLDYSLQHLQNDLQHEDNLFGISLAINTAQFKPQHERYISQSDIGLKLEFENLIEPKESWIKYYLLQAKKLFPTSEIPLKYTEAARFASVDKLQGKRIIALNEILGGSYVKYMLYCPRPDKVDEDTKTKLAYLRTKKLSEEIFDFTYGQHLYQALLNNGESLKAGLFLADSGSMNFGEVHAMILGDTCPLSWFIAINFLHKNQHLHSRLYSASPMSSQSPSGSEPSQRLLEGIMSGDCKVIEELISKIRDVVPDKLIDNVLVLPKHIIKLRVSVGEQLNHNNRRIRME